MAVEQGRRERSIHLLFGSLTLLIILSVVAQTAADADLWGHVTFGRDILRSGHVRQLDRYSFTSDLPWINHEWLAEVAMAAAYHLAGPVGLVALKLSLIWMTGAFLLASWRRHALPALWRDGLLFVTALGVWPLAATVRPQAFSVALFAALVFALLRVQAGSRGALLTIPPLFAVWVNTHGGWLVGAGVLAIFTGATGFDRAIPRRRKVAVAAAAVASAAACLVNPYGLAMLHFLADTVRPDRADILEWRPVTALPPAAFLLWAVPAVIAAAALWRNARAVPRWGIATVVVLAIGSLRVARLGGFFALAVGMLAAPALVRAPNAPPGRERPWSIDWPAVIGAVVAAALALGLFGRRIGMDGSWTPEPGAAPFVQTHALSGRLLTWFDYGEYAIWHFAPALRVSMDGRRETVYSPNLRGMHAEIYRDGPGALAAVDRLNPDYIWLPKTAPVVGRLESAGWHALYLGPRSVILGREIAPTVIDDRPVPTGRGFPGP